MTYSPVSSVLLFGAGGRMGGQLRDVITKSAPMTRIIPVDPKLPDAPDLPKALAQDPAVILDFSHPDALRTLLECLPGHPIPLVSGTTGVPTAWEEDLHTHAQQAPVLTASNFSLGINLLLAIVEATARRLDPSWSAEILETHHSRKQDAPSGTALSLAHAVAMGRGWDTDTFRTTRSGMIGPRPEEEIGIQTLRGGDVVGEHTVHFFGSGERVTLEHRATDRAILARGAWKAATWLISRPPGRYTMADVLSLSF